MMTQVGRNARAVSVISGSMPRARVLDLRLETDIIRGLFWVWINLGRDTLEHIFFFSCVIVYISERGSVCRFISTVPQGSTTL
jgi:hypothetical protein